MISQRLMFRADLGIRLPECEVVVANDAVKASVRQGAYARLATAVQTGAAEGMWSFERWRRWQESRDRLFVRARDAAREPLPEEAASEPAPVATRAATRPLSPPRSRAPVRQTRTDDGVLELEESVEDLASLVQRLR